MNRPLTWLRRVAEHVLRNGSITAGIALLLALTWFFTATQSSFSVYLFCTCALAVIGALALNLLMGTAGQVSIGTAAFLAVGAFSSVFLTRSGINFPWDVIVATLFSGAVGLVFGLPALRLRGLYLALSTLAAQFVILYVTNDYQQSSPLGAAVGFSVPEVFTGHGLDQQGQDWAWLLAIVVIVVMLIVRALMRTQSGRSWRLIRDHEVIAGTLGVNVARYKLIVFVLASALIGLEGALTAHFSGSVTTSTFTFLLAVQYIAMILIGGLDSIAGAVIGATLITLLPTLVSNILPGIIGQGQAALHGAQYSQIVYGILVLIFVTMAPGGIAQWFTAAAHLGSRWLNARGTSATGDNVAVTAAVERDPGVAGTSATVATDVGRQQPAVADRD